MAELIRLPEPTVQEVVEPKDSTYLVTYNDPFNPGDITTVMIPYGVSVFSVLKEFNYDIEFYDIVITRNQEVTSEDFIVEESDIVTVSVVPKGGGGAKQILGVIAMIAIVAVAPYAAGLALGAISGVVTSGAMLTGLWFGIQGAVIIGGSMLVSALTKPSAPSSPTIESFNSSPTYGWNTAGNVLAQGGVVPILYGKHRVTPQYIGKYLNTVDNTQHLKALLAVAEGPVDNITSIELNDLPLENYQNAIATVRSGTNTQTILPDFNDTWSDQQVSKELSYETWQYATTSGDQVQSITINLVCPNGLFYANDKGGLNSYSVNIDIEYKLVGSSTWLNFPSSFFTHNVAYYYVDQNPIPKNPGYYFSVPEADTTGPFDVYTYALPWKQGGVSVIAAPQYKETVSSVPVGLGKSAYPPNGTVTQMAWMETKQENIAPYVTIEGATTSAIRRAYTAKGLPKGKYDVRVKFYSTVNTSSRYGSATYFESLSEAILDDFTYPNTALLGLSIQATDQLSGGLPKISCIAERTSGPYGRLDNPAWAILDLLTNSRYGAGINISDIDFPSFQTWANYCTSKGHTVNIYLDQGLTLAQSIQVIGQLGRGTVLQYGSTFKALVDMPNITPAQGFLFTMGNIIQSSFSESFLPLKDRANVIEVTYYDAENNYERTAIEVAQGNYDLTSQVNKTSINMLGCTSRTQAVKYAKFLLNQNRYLTITASWEASIDSIQCKVGDIVNVSHDVPQWGFSGRILGNTLRTIEVDRDDLTMPAGSTYYVQVSDANTDEQIYVQVIGVSGNTLTVAEDLPVLGDYSVYAFGPVGRHAKLMRILSISTAQELTRKIVAIEYNEDVFNEDIPVPSPKQIGSLATNNLKVSESLTLGLDGTIRTLAQLSWTGFALSYKVYYKLVTESTFKLAGTAYGQTYTIEGLAEGFEYDFKVDNLTTRSFIYGKTLAPDAVTGLIGSESGNIFTLFWEYPFTPLDFKEFQVLMDGSVIGTTTAREFTTPRFVGGVSRTFEVIAVDTTGNESDPIEVTIPITEVPPVTNLQGTESGNVFTLTWEYLDKPSDFKEFEVFNEGVSLGTTASTLFQTKVLLGDSSKTFRVIARDTAGNESENTFVNIAILPVPVVSNLSGTESGNIFTLTWTYPDKPADFKEFIIKEAGVQIGSTTTNSFRSGIIYGRDFKIFTVTVVDTSGNVSNASSVTVNILPVPPVTLLYANISNGVLDLSWSYLSKPLDFSHYEIRHNGVYLATCTSESYATVAPKHIAGTINYQVYAVDSSGNKSTVTAVGVTISNPSVTNLSYSFSGPNVIVSWGSISNSYPLSTFEVTEGLNVYNTSATSITIPCAWLGNHTVAIKAIDAAGNSGNSSIAIPIVAPSAPVINSVISMTNGIEFSWTTVLGSCPIKDYLVVYNGNQIVTTDTFYFIPTQAQGSYTIQVYARDTAGNNSPVGSKTTAIVAPSVSNIVQTTTINTLNLTWEATQGSFNIKEFTVEYTDGLGVAQSSVVTTLGFSVQPNWLGSKVFTITPKDIAGNVGNAVQLNTTLSAPSQPVVTSTVVGKDVVISLAQTKGSFALGSAEVSYDGITTTIPVGTSSLSVPIFWDLEKNFTATSIDILGNRSTSTVTTVDILEGEVTNVTSEVVDNNVLLRWEATPGTLPIEHFRVLKGPDIATASEVGITKGTFSAVFEVVAGTFTYWIVPVDTAGNEGVYRGIVTTVSQPPDFILNVNWVSDWSGTKTNVKIDTVDVTKGVLPVNTTQNYQTHFTSYSWSTVQAQVTAGYPLWLTPSTTTASYSQTFDYGTVLGSTSITLTDPIVTKAGTGTYTMNRQIFTSLDGVTYTPQSLNSLQAFVTNIRYVRVDYSWSTSDAATLLTVGTFSLRLDAKIINDSGSKVCSASDVGGTVCNFNIPFVDVTAISITPSGTTPLIAVYDFVDVPNPTSFKVLLYTTAGVRANGTISWTATGY